MSTVHTVHIRKLNRRRFQPVPRSSQQFSRRHGLYQHLGATGSKTTLARLVVVVSRECDDDRAAGPVQRLDERQSITVGQREIEQRERRRIGAECAERLGDVRGGLHAAARGLEQKAERAGYELAVLDEEDGPFVQSAGASSGTVK